MGLIYFFLHILDTLAVISGEIYKVHYIIKFSYKVHMLLVNLRSKTADGFLLNFLLCDLCYT